MTTRVVVLGAGFGGMEICSTLSEQVPDQVEVTLIDKADAFVFGYSKLDVMFGRETLEAVRLPYAEFVKPGVTVKREVVTAIDPAAKTVTTDAATYEADVLVIALGADYDIAATPGLAEAGSEFYSVAGAAGLVDTLADLREGRVVIGVCDAPYKCPPAPSECALLLHDALVERGVRDQVEITLSTSLGSPVPPSPETSRALAEAFAARDIALVTGNRIAALDAERKVAVLSGGDELPFDLFLGVPKHRAPDVVQESGLAVDGYIPVDSATLQTEHPGVYAVGDCATAGVPKAGIFAEGAARRVAQAIVHDVAGGPDPERHLGQGACYIEFGSGEIARVDIDFLSGPERTGTYNAPSAALMAEKERFGSSRRARWFGR